MTNFSSQFKCTQDVGMRSALAALPAASERKAGVYNDGVLTILDERTAPQMLKSWGWLERRILALITTGLGDVFGWDVAESGVYFLNVQYGTLEFVDAEVDWVLDEFILYPEIDEKVLQQSRVGSLTRHLRELHYGETFIREPWAMFGGKDEDDRYAIGQTDVYLDLVGQTLQRAQGTKE